MHTNQLQFNFKQKKTYIFRERERSKEEIYRENKRIKEIVEIVKATKQRDANKKGCKYCVCVCGKIESSHDV